MFQYAMSIPALHEHRLDPGIRRGETSFTYEPPLLKSVLTSPTRIAKRTSPATSWMPSRSMIWVR